MFRWLTHDLQCQNLLGFSVFLQHQFNQTVTMASNPSLSNAFTFWRQQHNVFQVACYPKQKTSVIPFNWKLRGINNSEFKILITSLFISAFSVSRLKKAVLVWHLKLYFTNQEFGTEHARFFVTYRDSNFAQFRTTLHEDNNITIVWRTTRGNPKIIFEQNFIYYIYV